MSFDNIPHEMRAYRQWIVWRYVDNGGEKPDKEPFDAKTGKHASTTNPSTWCSYEEAVAQAPWYSGIGFCLSEADPFLFCDLDNTEWHVANGLLTQAEADVITARQMKVFQEFDSYSERSPSGKGLHIIVKGSIPAGRKRQFIELYSSARYMTMTGNVFEDKPIVDRQPQVQILWELMGGKSAHMFHDGNAQQTHSDEEILAKALAAANGVKFKALLDGDFGEYYGPRFGHDGEGRSEADFAFIDILAYYTQNRAQLRRMFRASVLGQAPKDKYKHRGDRIQYADYMIDKSFDRMLPPIDIEGMANQLELQLSEQRKADAATTKALPDGQASFPNFANLQPAKPTHLQNVPSGLINDIARFIYQSAPRPVPEVAIAGAIGLVAGICGRAYNVSGSGLNQYALLLAPTGTGKEAMSTGISRLMGTMKTTIPNSFEFIGPGDIRSDAALFKWLAKYPCIVSTIGEFGLALQQISDPRASSHEKGLKKLLLQLYNKSGEGKQLDPMAYSDKEKNVPSILAPSFTLLGESTPEAFYAALNESMITEGLLPRFITIEYTGQRPPLNEFHASVRPDFSLIDRLSSLTTQCLALSHDNRVIQVRANAETELLLKNFDLYCDARWNSAESEVERHFWSRVHMKVQKLAALLAVGSNVFEPTITEEHFNWARSLVVTDTTNLLKRFQRGDIGKDNEETKQERAVRKVCVEYISSSLEKVEGYMQSHKHALHSARLIPYVFINKKLAASAAFRHDPRGVTVALKRTLEALVRDDVLKEVPLKDMAKFGTSQKCYAVSQWDALSAA